MSKKIVGIVGREDFSDDQLHEINVCMWEQSDEANAVRDEYARNMQQQQAYDALDIPY